MEVESGQMYPAPIKANTVVMCCIAIGDQLYTTRLVRGGHQGNLVLYKKPTALPNIDKVIELVSAYPVWTNIDLCNSITNRDR